MKFFNKHIRLNTEAILLIGLALVTIVLRVYSLEKIPPGLYGDEGEFGLILNNINNKVYKSLFTIVDEGVFSFPVISFLPQLVIKNLFAQSSIVGIRLSSAILGAASVILFYFLARLYFKKSISLLLTLFLATSHTHVHYSRLAVNNIYPLFFSVATLFCFTKALITNKVRWSIATGLVLGAGLYSYHPFKILPVILIFFFLINLRLFMKGIIIFTAAFLIFVPQIIYYSQHKETAFARPKYILVTERQQVLANIKSNVLVFFTGKDNGYFVYGIRDYGLLSPLLAILFAFGLLLSYKKITEPKWQTIYLGIIITIIAVSFTIASPASHRLLQIIPSMILVSGNAIDKISQLIAKKQFLVLIMLIGSINFLIDHHIYFKYYINSNDGWPQREPATEVANYLKNLGPNWKVYMLREDSALYFKHATITYLNPNLEGIDIDDYSAPLPQPTNKNVVYIMPPHSPSINELKQILPQGKQHDFFNPRDAQPWFTTYEVENKDLVFD